MSLLRRSLWSRAERLPHQNQLFVAIVVNGYSFCRESIERRLVTPLEHALTEGLQGHRRTLTAGDKERLIDEALIAILRCSPEPSDGRGLVPDHMARRLPVVLGALACADSNRHAKRPGPHALSETAYSTHSATARTELLTKWGEHLDLPDRVTIAIELTGFADEWVAFTSSLLEEMLTGLERTGSEGVLSRARHVTDQLPAHLHPYIEALIQSAAKRIATSP